MLIFLLWTALVQHSISAPQFPEKVTDSSEGKVSLTSFHVDTAISFRYARTEVTARYQNPGSQADRAVFSLVLPKSAFISNFSLTIRDEEFVAEVKEKEEARRSYEEAVVSGATAGLVSKDRRDSNVFSVDANLEPGEKVVFSLTYDELLERKEGQYEYVLNIKPGKVLEDLLVTVNINESLPLSKLSVPELLQSNEIGQWSNEVTESHTAKVSRNVDGSPNNARVEFSPSKEDQQEAGAQGVDGKFVVRYDVDRQGQDSEVQVIDGYFVHYFAPAELPTLPKHVVFILDTSGSMGGEKIRQMKDAMFTVLDDLTETDYFNILEFNTEMRHWSGDGFGPANTEFYQATEENKERSINSVLSLTAGGGTDLNGAILAGLEVARTATRREALPKDVKSIVVFLTDGEATEGETDPYTIKANIKNANKDLEVPVFTVAFGADTDISLLQSIATQNNAVSKRIYEGSDAALQLEDFYAQISSPLLTDLKFEYVGGLENSSISRTEVNTLFDRREFIVTGKLSEFDEERPTRIGVNISGVGKDLEKYERRFDICLRSSSQSSSPRYLQGCLQPREYPKSPAQNFLQKLFAFQHIQQLLQEVQTADTEEERERLRREARELSVENNFVTDLTSLVVIRPDQDPKLATLTDVTSLEQIPQPGGVYLRNSSTFSRISGFSSGLMSSSRVHSYSARRRPPPPRRIQLSSAIPSSAYSFSIADYDYDDYSDYAYDYAYPGRPVSTTTPVPSTSTVDTMECTLILYSKTYHRGDKLELPSSEPDLSSSQLAGGPVSAQVTGQCCWELHSSPLYSGEVLTLRPGGDYTSVTSLGNLFRNTRSVRRVRC